MNFDKIELKDSSGEVLTFDSSKDGNDSPFTEVTGINADGTRVVLVPETPNPDVEAVTVPVENVTKDIVVTLTAKK